MRNAARPGSGLSQQKANQQLPSSKMGFFNCLRRGCSVAKCDQPRNAELIAKTPPEMEGAEEG